MTPKREQLEQVVYGPVQRPSSQFEIVQMPAAWNCRSPRTCLIWSKTGSMEDLHPQSVALPTPQLVCCGSVVSRSLGARWHGYATSGQQETATRRVAGLFRRDERVHAQCMGLIGFTVAV